MHMQELWKELPFSNSYLISNCGKVKNSSGRIIKQWFSLPNKKGYKQVQLHICRKRVVFRIHRLVACCFLGLDIDDRNSVVMHIDDDTENNIVTNLKVGTHKENTGDIIKKGNRPKIVRTLSDNDYKEIVRLGNQGIHYYEIAEKFGISSRHAMRIKNRSPE